MSLSVNETELDVVLIYPKSGDLDIKAFNPHFWGSLGFRDVAVSVSPQPVAATNPVQTGGGDQSHTVSFPYNQFVFLLKGENPHEHAPEPEPQPEPEPVNIHTPSKPFSYFSNALDKIFQMFFAKSNASSSVPPVAQPSETSNAAPSVQPVAQENRTIWPTMDIKTSGVTDVSPTIPKEENQLLVSPQEPPAQPLPQPTAQPIVQNFYITAPSGQQSIVSNIPKEPVGENIQEPSKMEQNEKSPQIPLNEMPKQPIMEPSTSILPTSTENTSVELPKEPVGENIQEIPKMEQNEKSPQILENEMSKQSVSASPQPISKPETPTFWKITIPKGTNSPKVFEETEVGEKYEQHFRDVLLFHKQEVKSGIYVAGKFYDVLGRKLKIGKVEPSSPDKNTIKDYLLSVPPLEGTLMDKYRKIYIA